MSTDICTKAAQAIAEGGKEKLMDFLKERTFEEIGALNETMGLEYVLKGGEIVDVYGAPLNPKYPANELIASGKLCDEKLVEAGW